MKFQWEIMALVLIVVVGAIFWPKNALQEPPTMKVDEPVPSVVGIGDFFKFPWGISREQAQNIATERKLQPSPKGFMDYRGANPVYDMPFAGYPARIYLDFRARINTQYSVFYRGSIVLSGRTCPIEKLYWQLYKELTDKYGSTPDLGYPPRRNSGDDKPWGPGSGAIWEIRSPDGQLFEIEASLDLSDPGFLRLTYHNISVERSFKNLVNPIPEGDPTQAASALKGFMDIPWGASPTVFRQGMENNGFSSVKEATSPNNHTAHTSFEIGTYEGYLVKSVDAYFKHDIMYMVSVSISGNSSDGGDGVYNNVKDVLQKKYGAPLEEKDYRQEIVHIWPFPLEGFKPNHIMLHRKGALVMVLYMNRALEDKLNNL